MTTTTFLLDLDNTLLDNPMSKFLPAYFAALEKRLSQSIHGQALRQLMIASAQVMQANQDPTVTNMTAFINDFAERVGFSVEATQNLLKAFYHEDYPQLQQYTTFKPEAPKVVNYLVTQGYAVVIATNPLFPATAIEQRMAWAGIDGFPYARVTTMENSHFSKPDPRYYQEILTQVESTPETTWMVGDHLKNDIAPAHELGLKTWWITPLSSDHANTESIPLYNKKGTLADFLAWLKSSNSKYELPGS